MKIILIIDDNEVFSLILAEWLKTEGFYPITANSGSEGIQLAQSYQPNLIFCDVNMPIVNGIEVLKQLRNDPNLSHIPFFFLTSETGLNLDRIKRLGATGILAKDAEVHKLREVLTVTDMRERM